MQPPLLLRTYLPYSYVNLLAKEKSVDSSSQADRRSKLNSVALVKPLVDPLAIHVGIKYPMPRFWATAHSAGTPLNKICVRVSLSHINLLQ